MMDLASHSLPQPDNVEVRHTMTVHDVGAALVAAGVPRSHRQVVRYAETGMLDAVKVPGPTGAQWFVSPASLPKVIGDLKQWQTQRASHSETGLVTSSRVSVENPVHSNTDIARHGAPQPAMSDKETSDVPAKREPDTAGHVTQLQERIEEKNDVIDLLKGQLAVKDQQIADLSTRFGNLSDRFADTQKLLGAMQRMFAPLLGQSDPFEMPAGREVSDRVDKSGTHDANVGV